MFVACWRLEFHREILNALSEPKLAPVEVLADLLAFFCNRAILVALQFGCARASKMMNSRNSVNALFLRSGIAPLHHDVSEKDLNLGLFRKAAPLDDGS